MSKDIVDNVLYNCITSGHFYNSTESDVIKLINSYEEAIEILKFYAEKNNFSIYCGEIVEAEIDYLNQSRARDCQIIGFKAKELLKKHGWMDV